MNRELISIIPTLPLIQNPEDINRATNLENDLRLFGFEARGFLFHYSEMFDVDISRFPFNKYFSKDTAFNRIFRHFFKRRKNIITMGDLEDGIKCGRLDSKTLQDNRQKNNELKRNHKKIYLKTNFHYKPEDAVVYILLVIAISMLLGIVALRV